MKEKDEAHELKVIQIAKFDRHPGVRPYWLGFWNGSNHSIILFFFVL